MRSLSERAPRSAGEGTTLAQLIELVCRAHARREHGLTTVEDGRWAYCPGGAPDGHAWEGIDPTMIELVERRYTRERVPASKEATKAGRAQ